MPYATWDDLREGLRFLLQQSCNPAPGTITLSNVKRLFRSDLQLELSETVLGHSRVCELLQDERLRAVCRVEVVGNGQALVHNVPAMVTSGWGPASAGGTLLLSTCASNRPLLATALPAACPMLESRVLSTVPAAGGWSSMASASSPKACFSNADSETDASPCNSSVAESLETCSCMSSAESWVSHSDLEVVCSSASVDDLEVEAPELILSPAFAGQGFVIRNTFIDEEPRQLGARRRSQSLPRQMRLARTAGQSLGTIAH